MRKTNLLLVSISMFCAYNSFSQTLLGADAERKIQGAQWIEYSESTSRPTFIEFNPSSSNFRLAVANPVEMMREVLKLKPVDDLISYKQEHDELGFTHIRYQQTYKNIPVELGEYTSHQKSGLLDCISGVFLDVNDVTVTPSINEAAALSKALAFVGATKYKWENAAELAQLREAFEDPTFNYDPTGSLVIFPKNDELGSKAIFRLAYKFNIYAELPEESRADIFVDAITGEIIGRHELLHSADATGTANTKYSGKREIKTTLKGSSYVLQETGRGKGIATYNARNAATTDASYPATDFTDSDNIWNNFNANWDEAATDAHWATEMTYDYYMNVHGRNSVDNKGFKLINYVHVGTNWFNANWNGSFMRYGDGKSKPLTAIDIGGHEMSHGVTSNSAKLVYQNESGALNESFSDIFGNMVEFYADSATASWLIGEDIGAIRDMKNPNTYKNPDTYQGTYWATGSGDQGGVHTNSGVQNKWFYILSMGEKGTNDKNGTYDVKGITRQKAAKIAFRNLTVYLTPSSNYASARTNSLKAAKDLYGECSPEYIATGNAWNAVNVGAKVECAFPPVAGFSTDVTKSCDGVVKFTDESTSSPTSWLWDFGDSQTSTQQNPSHTFAKGKTYTVKLTATNSYGKDDEIKTSYITIYPELLKPVITSTITGKITTLSVPSGNTYQWYFNGSEIPGETNESYTPSKTGNYTVMIKNSDKCAATSDVFSFTIGINVNELDAAVRIYPNPANDFIYIESSLKGTNTIAVSIYSVLGKLVYQETYSNSLQPHLLNTGSIEANGIYFIKLQSRDETVLRKLNINR